MLHPVPNGTHRFQASTCGLASPYRCVVRPLPTTQPVIQARDQMTPWVPPSSCPPPHRVKSQVPTFYLPHVSGFTLSGPWDWLCQVPALLATPLPLIAPSVPQLCSLFCRLTFLTSLGDDDI